MGLTIERLGPPKHGGWSGHSEGKNLASTTQLEQGIKLETSIQNIEQKRAMQSDRK